LHVSKYAKFALSAFLEEKSSKARIDIRTSAHHGLLVSLLSAGADALLYNPTDFVKSKKNGNLSYVFFNLICSSKEKREALELDMPIPRAGRPHYMTRLPAGGG
jgi:hypothetical protein